MKRHNIKSTPSHSKSAISLRNNLDTGNFADPKGRHFIISNQKDLELAQKRLRRAEGAEEIKKNISNIAERKGLEIKEGNWKIQNYGKNIAENENKA